MRRLEVRQSIWALFDPENNTKVGIITCTAGLSGGKPDDHSYQVIIFGDSDRALLHSFGSLAEAAEFAFKYYGELQSFRRRK